MLLQASELPAFREEHSGDSLVLVQGTFDLLHPGHVRHLEVAKSLGTTVAVALWADEQIARRKGADRPFIPIEDRLAMVDAFKQVDAVFEMPGIGGRDEVIDPIIRSLQPDYYLVSGQRVYYDGQPVVDHADSGRHTSIVYDVSYTQKTRSTSLIAEKVRTSAHATE